MEPDKLNKWLEVAKQFAGGDFWNDIFEKPGLDQVMGKHPYFRGESESKPPDVRVDILKQAGYLIVLLDIPGMSKSDIELALAGDHLVIKGTAKPLFPHAEVLSTERLQGGFERKIPLPERVTERMDSIRAACHEGLLIVQIPILSVPLKPIKIE
ncbi:Hsp20/alpha crystallin family protein [Paenibacillus allorhizosphaerae]|uniref:Salt stress-responsive protein YocM n=1 Tax=Paenibacillus allorhizosphaerae TaxID=2849866 RepID=A0ABN7TT43_9BACL|nr:Hsp20/alpha crystallin family protein [Paenibacillus allorhizosphaerae]CAG7650094.1 Salt stress-responsive protein YocM [Paenibacillus allorhizosphaerae]